MEQGIIRRPFAEMALDVHDFLGTLAGGDYKVILIQPHNPLRSLFTFRYTLER
jgi:hypothetical protein